MTKFEQIKLNYGAGDYAPVINQETIETHHGKHHKTYTDTLNKLVEENNIECSSIE
ncbi:MAG: superoxide dismutase, partial [Lachnospiraceae bacterium]|nr:superoxide dismutase [Lachnospiraceae bacterium]